MVGFALGIKKSGDRYRRKATRVYAQSIIDLLEYIQTPWQMGGHMPIKTGRLQDSLMVFYKSTTAVSGAYAFRALLGIITLDFKVRAFWTVYYAKWQEHGFMGYPGKHFVALGAQKWSAIVEKNISRFRNMK